VQVEARISEEMMCIAESSFIAIIVTVSLLCILFSGVIVAWGCSKLRGNSKLQQAAGSGYSSPKCPKSEKMPAIIPVIRPVV